MKSKFKITCAYFACIGSALCAAESETIKNGVTINNTWYDLSLPYIEIPKTQGKKMAFIPQGFFTVMHQNSPRDYLITAFCRPCIGIVIKHKRLPSRHPIIMGHQDFLAAPENLVNAIKTYYTKEADLQLTFYSDIKQNWSEKNVNIDGKGIEMTSWEEVYGGASQKEAFDNCVSFYAKIFPSADINKILNPFNHPSSILKRNAFIDTTVAVGKKGDIFTFSPLVTSICGLDNMLEGHPNRNIIESQPDLATQCLQEAFRDIVSYGANQRYQSVHADKDGKLPFIEMYITE